MNFYFTHVSHTPLSPSLLIKSTLYLGQSADSENPHYSLFSDFMFPRTQVQMFSPLLTVSLNVTTFYTHW